MCHHLCVKTVSIKQLHATTGQFVREAANHAIYIMDRDVLLAVTPALVRQTCATLAGLDRKICRRAADALHLATAVDAGCESLYRHDRHILMAAPVFGMPAHDILLND